MELYKNLGFIANPFSTFSAEEEKSFLKNVYIEPLFFRTLQSDVTQGASRFIIGARGTGKTALLTRLKEVVDEDKVFSVIIDDYDGIPPKYNESDFLRAIIQKIVTCFSFEASRYSSTINRLNSNQKDKLAYIIKDFFKTTSKREYEQYYNKANPIRRRNIFRNIYNFIFNRPINFFISGGVEIIAETVRKSFSLPEPISKDFYKNYLPELKLETIGDISSDELFKDSRALKAILNDICEIIKSCGYKTTVVYFDKIDEYTKLNSSITFVAEFLEGLLKDTTILMNPNYSLVFSIWDVLRPELENRGVRFDKIKPIDITWNSQNMKDILTKRIKYFSNGNKEIKDIIAEEEDIISIIQLANNSPRYLFRILSYIYDAQSESNSNSIIFTKESINRGQLLYAKNFGYYSIYATKRGTKDDIIRNVNRLLKIGKKTLLTKDFVETYKVSTPTALSYIQITQEYDLVKQLPQTDKGANVYEIKDPVINYLIDAGITEIQR